MPFNDYAGLNLTTPYDTPEYQTAYNAAAGSQTGRGSSDRAGLVKRLNQFGDQFKTLFANNVGRAATQDEISKFYGQGLTSAGIDAGNGQADPTQVRNQMAQWIGDTFQPEAQATAQSKLTDLSTQAGTLADQFLSMGKTSLGNLANDLQDYQTRLFDKLRPQLNLSAQAGGFQDSGGQTLQEQGALKDLGTAAMGTLIPLQNQLETQANAIRYGGAAAPYSLASSFAAGQPSTMAAAGANALGANTDSFMSNLNFAHQMALLQMQGGIESNLADQSYKFGNNFTKSFGSGMGTNLADLAQQGGQGGLGKLAPTLFAGG